MNTATAILYVPCMLGLFLVAVAALDEWKGWHDAPERYTAGRHTARGVQLQKTRLQRRRRQGTVYRSWNVTSGNPLLYPTIVETVD